MISDGRKGDSLDNRQVLEKETPQDDIVGGATFHWGKILTGKKEHWRGKVIGGKACRKGAAG